MESSNDNTNKELDDADSDDLQFVDNLDIDQVDNEDSKVVHMDGSHEATSSHKYPTLSIDSVKPSATHELTTSDSTKHKEYSINNTISKISVEESPAPTAEVISSVNSGDEKPIKTEPIHSTDTKNSESTEDKAQQIIKHFIEGFIIEESSSPFPVHRSSLLTDMQVHTKKRGSRKRTNANTSSSQGASRAPTPSSSANTSQQNLPVALQSIDSGQCTLCKRQCINKLFYKSEPYCSKSCVYRRKKLLHSQSENQKSLLSLSAPGTAFIKSEPMEPAAHFPGENGYESEDSALYGSDLAVDGFRRGDVFHWTISDVRDFIQTLDGCERYATVFEEQEIDGRALLLINEDHLLNALDIKLGPALKIISEINTFR